MKSFNSDKLDFFVEGELLKFQKNDLRKSPNHKEIETVSNFLKNNIKPNDIFIFMSYFTGNLQKEFFDRVPNTNNFERIEFLKDILNFCYRKFYDIKELTNDLHSVKAISYKNTSAWEKIDNRSNHELKIINKLKQNAIDITYKKELINKNIKKITTKNIIKRSDPWVNIDQNKTPKKLLKGKLNLNDRSDAWSNIDKNNNIKKQ